MTKSVNRRTNKADVQPVQLTVEQKAILQMSEEDIKNGRLITQEELAKQDQEWLNGLQLGGELLK